jgi:hypothetical protein
VWLYTPEVEEEERRWAGGEGEEEQRKKVKVEWHFVSAVADIYTHTLKVLIGSQQVHTAFDGRRDAVRGGGGSRGEEKGEMKDTVASVPTRAQARRKSARTGNGREDKVQRRWHTTLLLFLCFFFFFLKHKHARTQEQIN